MMKIIKKIDAWIYAVCILVIGFQNKILLVSNAILGRCIIAIAYIGLIGVLIYNKNMKQQTKVILVSLFLIAFAINLYVIL